MGQRGPRGPAKIELLYGLGTKACDVAVNAETLVVFELEAWLSVSLRVVDRDRRPIAGARVFGNVREGNLRHEVVGSTDTDGRFVGTSVLRSFESWVEADGYAPSEGVFADKQKRQVRRTLVLDKPAGTLRGRVLDAAGVPVPATLVAIQPVQPGQKRPPRAMLATTDAQGAFETRSVPFGSVHVFALADRQLDAAGYFLVAKRSGRARMVAK